MTQVYVLHQNGQPLMPTTPGKARQLLKQNKAKILHYEPFTIRLRYETPAYTQPVTLGVDSGSTTIGLSASTEKKELFSAEVVLRRDVSDNLTERAMYRRNRRNRKTRYRQARFLNRVKSKHKGWLAPSIEHKIVCHQHMIDRVHRLLPIAKIIVETASFDTQLMQHPGISGVQYQQGAQLGFFNTREFVLFRDNHTCQLCKGKKNDPILNVHHLVYRSMGGTDAPSNLITLCNSCHTSVNHKPGKPLWAWCQAKKTMGNFKSATFMGIMRPTLLKRLKEHYPVVEETFGYVTKNHRIRANLAKTHAIDALMITGNVRAQPLQRMMMYKKVRQHNRSLHKATIRKGGHRKSNQASFEVKGFRLFDKVLFEGQTGFITGRRTTGYFAIKTMDGGWIHKSGSYKKCQVLQRRSNYIQQEVNRLVSSPL